MYGIYRASRNPQDVPQSCLPSPISKNQYNCLSNSKVCHSQSAPNIHQTPDTRVTRSEKTDRLAAPSSQIDDVLSGSK